MQTPQTVAYHVGKKREEAAAIVVVTIDVTTFIAAAGEVPDGTRKFKT
jgi:hypothetical protein